MRPKSKSLWTKNCQRCRAQSLSSNKPRLFRCLQCHHLRYRKIKAIWNLNLTSRRDKRSTKKLKTISKTNQVSCSTKIWYRLQCSVFTSLIAGYTSWPRRSRHKSYTRAWYLCSRRHSWFTSSLSLSFKISITSSRQKQQHSFFSWLSLWHQ